VKSEEIVFAKTEQGQFFYDVAMSDKKIGYLERKWKQRHLRELRYQLRAVLRRDRKTALS
jgi:hypothetical protein